MALGGRCLFRVERLLERGRLLKRGRLLEEGARTKKLSSCSDSAVIKS